MNKQIEEMAKVLDDCPYIAASIGCDKYAGSVAIAKYLYNADYRKASEVARDIIADLVKFADDKERQMSFHGHSVWYIDADDVTDFIAELKKKYIQI